MPDNNADLEYYMAHTGPGIDLLLETPDHSRFLAALSWAGYQAWGRGVVEIDRLKIEERGDGAAEIAIIASYHPGMYIMAIPDLVASYNPEVEFLMAAEDGDGKFIASVTVDSDSETPPEVFKDMSSQKQAELMALFAGSPT